MSKRPTRAPHAPTEPARVEPKDKDDLTRTIRRYLAEVYRLSTRADDADSYVSTSALAESLNVSPPAVNRMVNKLRDLRLLDHEPYRGIALTESGRREALRQLRRHRIVEAFLVSVMGFGWHEIHDDADEMSSELTDTLEARMYAMAGRPTTCPHGEPIPEADGTLNEPDDIVLTNAPLKHLLVITRVRTRETDRLDYLGALSLMPGTHVEVIHIAPFNGPMQLRVGREYRIIGHNLAEMIRVAPHDSA